MPNSAEISGSSAVISRGDRRSRNGSAAPAAPPRIMPAVASLSVTSVSRASSPETAISQMRTSVSTGPGSHSRPIALRAQLPQHQAGDAERDAPDRHQIAPRAHAGQSPGDGDAHWISLRTASNMSPKPSSL